MLRKSCDVDVFVLASISTMAVLMCVSIVRVCGGCICWWLVFFGGFVVFLGFGCGKL